MQFGWNFIFSRFYQEKKAHEISIITLWFWFVKHRWSFANNLYIEKEIMNLHNNWWSLLCEVLLLSMTLMEDTVFIFFFFWFYIFVCCIPNYTMFVYWLEFKKIISFPYKKDLVSRCVCIDIKVDNFVYLWFEFIFTE